MSYVQHFEECSSSKSQPADTRGHDFSDWIGLWTSVETLMPEFLRTTMGWDIYFQSNFLSSACIVFFQMCVSRKKSAFFCSQFVLFNFLKHPADPFERSHARCFKTVDSGNSPTNLYSIQTVQSTVLPSFLQKKKKEGWACVTWKLCVATHNVCYGKGWTAQWGLFKYQLPWNQDIQCSIHGSGSCVCRVRNKQNHCFVWSDFKCWSTNEDGHVHQKAQKMPNVLYI